MKASMARFCGLTILPSTSPEEFEAAISTGSRPASFAVVTGSRQPGLAVTSTTGVRRVHQGPSGAPNRISARSPSILMIVHTSDSPPG